MAQNTKITDAKAWFPLHGKRHDNDTKQSVYKVEQSSFTVIALF